MKRYHLFEFEDFSWFPATLRNRMTDYLRFAITLFKMADPVIPILDRLMTDTGCRTIVDLASGGGGPWGRLAPALAERHPDLTVVLTDRYPNLPAMRTTKERAPDHIAYREAPVDALDVPADLPGIRTQFLSLHHFEPEEVAAIFRSAIAARVPIAVFEFQERSVAQVIQYALSPIFVLLLTPFIRPFSLNRLLFTYLIPLVPICIMWDGIVSALRTYTVDEVRALVAAIPGADSYAWDIDAEKEGPVTVFRAVGRPRD